MNSGIPGRTGPRRSLTAVGVFLAFGACMAALAGTTLLWRGTALDRVWALNASAYRQLEPTGAVAGTLFLLLSGILALATVGWRKRRLWGWGLTIGVIATHVAGDLVNLARGDLLRGGIGFVIAGALLIFLLSAQVRAAFRKS